jgi:hypothetical protein
MVTVDAIFRKQALGIDDGMSMLPCVNNPLAMPCHKNIFKAANKKEDCP